MRPEIENLISDLGLQRELVDNLKNRSLNQKFRYLGDGAKLYYSNIAARGKSGLLPPDADFKSFIIPEVAASSLAFVSLGCGNATKEGIILKALQDAGVSAAFFGIDTSRSMLDMAIEGVASFPGKKSFVCADVVSMDFRDEIRHLTAPYEKRLFAFLDRTIGNVNQTNIADTLYNVMQKGDLLWFDVTVRPGVTAAHDMQLFNRYAGLLSVPQTVESYFLPLKLVGVPLDAGTMQIASDKEESVGALIFKFSFVFSKKVVVSIRGETLHFLPGEKIHIFTIRAYYPEMLVRFFQERGFRLKKNTLESTPDVASGQFLFEKTDL